MKKKIIIGLLLLATVFGVLFAANWCAAAKCKDCGAYVEFTTGASSQKEAERIAKSWIVHKETCKHKNGSKIVTRAAEGACPKID